LGTSSLSWPSFQTPTCTHPCASSTSTCPCGYLLHLYHCHRNADEHPD
jgi:hypothetical protein